MAAAGAGPGREVPICSSRPGPRRLSGPRQRGAHARRHDAGRDRQEGRSHQRRLTGREPSGRPCASRPGCCRQRHISLPGGVGTRAGHTPGPGWFINRSPKVNPERSYSPGFPPAGLSWPRCPVPNCSHRKTGLRADHRRKALMARQSGYRLAEERKRHGLTQAQLAQAMGVTPGRVSQIERGEVATIDAIARYIEALGGRLDLVASFGNHTLTVATTKRHDGPAAPPGPAPHPAKPQVRRSATAPASRRGHRRAVQVPPRARNDHGLTSGNVGRNQTSRAACYWFATSGHLWPVGCQNCAACCGLGL
jgi:transcriptional regulator with XRE-family HTH domain